MAWPRCPNCLRPVDVYERAHEVRPAETEVFRSYGCPCGWRALSVERIYCTDPDTLRLGRKYPKSGLPVGHTPVTSDP